MITAVRDYVFNGQDDNELKAVSLPLAYLRLLSSLATSDIAWVDGDGNQADITSLELSAIERGLYQEDLTMLLALGTSISLLQMFPGIVGIWPMSITNGAGQAVDISGNGLHLTNFGASPVAFGVDGAEFVSSQSRYLEHADNSTLDITGLEAHVGQGGLTIGGWFQQPSPLAQTFASKFGAVGQRSFWLLNTGASYRFVITSNGSSTVNVTSPASLTSSYVFLAARFVPLTSLSIFVNGDVVSNTTSIPLSIFNSTAPFRIGAITTGNYLTGFGRLSFLSSSAVEDDDILRFYNASKALFI